MENRFAAARRRYLCTHMDGIYTGMLLMGTLQPHLKEIGESAQAMLDQAELARLHNLSGAAQLRQ